MTPFAKDAVVSLAKDKGWRPQTSIRGKVIGLAKHKDRLLVCEVLNDQGMLKGWCPLGGGIEIERFKKGEHILFPPNLLEKLASI